jgi:hypothetical protein
MRKSCRGTIITLRIEVSLTGNGENPALVLSNVHKGTSAPDGPSFGYIGLSMNTTSLSMIHLQVTAPFLMYEEMYKKKFIYENLLFCMLFQPHFFKEKNITEPVNSLTNMFCAMVLSNTCHCIANRDINFCISFVKPVWFVGLFPHLLDFC